MALSRGLSNGLRERRGNSQIWACGAVAALASQPHRVGILLIDAGRGDQREADDGDSPSACLLHLMGRTCGCSEACGVAREHAALALGYAASHKDKRIARWLSESSAIVNGLGLLTAGGPRVPPKARQHAVRALAALCGHPCCHLALIGEGRRWGGGEERGGGGEWNIPRALVAALDASIAVLDPT